MAAPKNKYLGQLYLPVEDYKRLEREAIAAERDPLQQARWLIRHALGAGEQPKAEASYGR
jgi:hypothetical protein